MPSLFPQSVHSSLVSISTSEDHCIIKHIQYEREGQRRINMRPEEKKNMKHSRETHASRFSVHRASPQTHDSHEETEQHLDQGFVLVKE